MEIASEDQYLRLVQTSVTIFIHCGPDYLFLKRGLHKRIDAGRLNGIGGRVEPGEDFLSAAIRETEEETGYKLDPQDLELVTVGKLEGGYKEDWVMCFFKVEVPAKRFPKGLKTDDGELIWVDQDQVLTSDFELVDDLNYVFKDIIKDRSLIFFTAQVNDQEKIASITVNKIPKSRKLRKSQSI